MEESEAHTEEGAHRFRRPRRTGPPGLLSEIQHKLVTYWVLARLPWRLQFAVLGVLYMMVFGRAVYSAPVYNIPLLIEAFVIVALIVAGGCAMNDYFDRDADAISKPHRPIPAGDISARGVLEYVAVTWFVGAALCLYLNLLAFGIVVAVCIWLVLYPSVVKRFSGLLAALIQAFAASLIAVFGEVLLLGQISYLSLSFIPMITVSGLSAMTFIDIVTTAGDEKKGYATAPVKYGVPAAVGIAIAGWALSIVFNYIPYVLAVVGISFAAVVTIYAFTRIYVIQSLIRKPTVANVRSLMPIAMGSFVLVPIALLAGAFL